MAVKNTRPTAVKVAKPKFIYATPWVEDTNGVLEKGDTTYNFQDVLQDSTSFSQDEPTENPIENEVSDEPIMNNITLGTKSITTTICDIQEGIIQDFLGFEVDANGGRVYAPAGYTELFAEIAIVLDKGGDKYVAYVFPKVQLASRQILESLSSGMAQVELSGTALSADVEGLDGTTTYTCNQYIDYDYTLPV